MKKILVVNTVPFLVNGISTVIMNYYENINHDEFQFDFVINDYIAQKYKEYMQQHHAKIFILNRKKSLLKYLFDLYRLIRREQYDIVHVHGNSCTMAIELLGAMLAGCKCRIAHCHNVTCDHMVLNNLLRPLFEMCVTKRVACSEAAGCWLFGESKFVVLENAMDISKYRYNEDRRYLYRKELKCENDEIVLGHIGRFNRQKNQEFLITVFQKLYKEEQKVKLLLVGEGSRMPQLMKNVCELGLDDKILFYGESDDVAGLMSAMDVFVFPSKFEGLGMVMIEAQLSGLPCVASNRVPKDTALSDACVYLDLEDDIAVWESAIRDFIYKERNRNECANIDAERFDIEIQVRRLQEIYLGEC